MKFSTCVCKIIYELWIFCVKNKIIFVYLQIYIFSFTNFFWKNKFENYKIFIDNIINVKMPRKYVNKYNININVTFMYNKPYDIKMDLLI
jgi:hypothetical protein